VATTHASVPDVALTQPIHADLQRRQVLPAEHDVDSGYPSADLLVSSLTSFGVRLLTRCWPTPHPRPAPGRLRPHRVHHRLG